METETEDPEMEKTVVALYDNLDTAQTAVRDLIDNGFSRDDISVVRTNQRGDYTTGNMAHGESDASSAAAGAGIGAVLGGLAGLLVGLGALAIPGIGPIVAAGPLATALAGAGLGAATGGLVGALADAGVPEDDAGNYAEGVRRGGTLVTVRTEEDQVERAADILNRFAPVDINQRAGEWGVAHTPEDGILPRSTSGDGADKSAAEGYRSDTGTTGVAGGALPGNTANEGYTGTGTVYGGGGSYTGDMDRPRGADISESPDRVGSSTRDDEDSIMRTGHGSMSTSTGFAGQGGGTYERMQEENPDVHPRSAEGDYQARRAVLNEDEARSKENAREQASNVESSEGEAWAGQYGGHQGSLAGGASLAGSEPSARRVEDYDPDFRNDWESNYRSTGYGFERYRPAYLYGWQLGERYQGRDWGDFEAEARSTWEQNNPDDAWQDYSSAARYGWDQYREGAPGTRNQALRGQTYGAQADAYRASAAEGDRSGGQEFGRQQVDYGYDRTMGEMNRRFETYDRDFRSDWDRSFRSTGYGYERYQPAYQYGYNLATEPKYQGRTWTDVEPEARRDWETRHPNDAWEDFKEAVQHAWVRVRNSANDALD